MFSCIIHKPSVTSYNGDWFYFTQISQTPLQLMLICFYTGNETTGKRSIKMMCVRGYSLDVSDAIHLDEKLEAASKLPPNKVQFEKSFTGTYEREFLIVFLLLNS